MTVTVAAVAVAVGTGQNGCDCLSVYLSMSGSSPPLSPGSLPLSCLDFTLSICGRFIDPLSSHKVVMNGTHITLSSM